MRIRTQVIACAAVCAASVAALVAGARFTRGPNAAAPDLAWLPDLPSKRPELLRVSPFAQGPARFEPNVGQAPEGTRWLRRGAYDVVHLADDGFTTVVRGRHPMPMRDAEEDVPHGVRVSFEGGAAAPVSTAEEPLDCRTNYFVGRDPAGWKRDVPNFARVRYAGVWPGIDVVFHGRDGRMEYDFLVAPGADPSAIALDIAGAEDLRIDERGDLVLGAGPCEIRHRRPQVWQDGPGGRRALACAFERNGATGVRFRIDGRDAALPTVIDPTVEVSRRIGGGLNDAVVAIDGAPDGRVYCGGVTLSTSFNAVGTITGTRAGSSDGFLCAFPPVTTTATAPIAFNIVGSTGSDGVTDLRVAQDGDVFASFHTSSGSSFPRLGGQDYTSLSDVDAALVGFSPSLGTVRVSFPFGAGLDDICTSIDVLPFSGNKSTQAVFAGLLTDSADFPGYGALPAGRNAIVLRFAADGSQVGVHHIGNPKEEIYTPVRVALDDANDSIFLAATGDPSGFLPTPGAFAVTTTAASSGFVENVALDFSQVNAATFIPGTSESPIYAIASIPGGGVGVVGSYSFGTMPTTANAAFPGAAASGQRGFYAAFSAGLSTLHTLTDVRGPSGVTFVSDLLVVGTVTASAAILGGDSNGLAAFGGGTPFHGVLGGGPTDIVISEIPALGGTPLRISCEGGTDSETPSSSSLSLLNVEFGRHLAAAGGRLVLGATTAGNSVEFPELSGTSLGGFDGFARAVTSTALVGGPESTTTFDMNFVTGSLTIPTNSEARGRATFSFTLAGEDGARPDLGIGGDGIFSMSVSAPTSTASLGTLFEIEAPMDGAKITKAGKVAVLSGVTSDGTKFTVTIDTRRTLARVSCVLKNIPGLAEPVGTPIGGAPYVIEVDVGEGEGRTVCGSKKPKRGTRRLIRRIEKVLSRLEVLPKKVEFGQPNFATALFENTGTEPQTVTVIIKHKGFPLLQRDVTVPGVDPVTFLAGLAQAITSGTTPAKGLQKWTLTVDGKVVATQTTTTQ